VRVSVFTFGSRFSTRETVLIDTPDRRATSWIVTLELKTGLAKRRKSTSDAIKA
jgi:hypothetical protein